MINSEWLKTFCTLAETKNFTTTAKALFMTQSGVSQQIRKLEDDLGQQLIIRGRKHFELTPQGRSVLDYARQVLAGDKLLRSRISDTDPYQGNCAISGQGGVGTLIYPWLLDIQQQWPKLNIHFTFNPTKDVEKTVKKGECDIGFITHTANDPELVVEPISVEYLCLVLPKEIQYSDFQHLNNLGFIDHPDGKLIAAEVLPQVFKEDDIDVFNLKTSGYINHVGMICDPVAKGFGYTVLHEYIVRLSPFFHQLKVVIPKERPSHRINVIYKKKWPLHPRYRFVIDNLKLRFDEQGDLT